MTAIKSGVILAREHVFASWTKMGNPRSSPPDAIASYINVR